MGRLRRWSVSVGAASALHLVDSRDAGARSVALQVSVDCTSSVLGARSAGKPKKSRKHMVIKMLVRSVAARTFSSKAGQNVVVTCFGMEEGDKPLLSVIDAEFGMSEFDKMGVKGDHRDEKNVLADVQRLKGRIIEYDVLQTQTRGNRTQFTGAFVGFADGKPASETAVKSGK